jgi:hypothetical protein
MSRDVCYICGNKNRDVLEEHHIVPQRFGGSDDDENTVQLCSNCHTSLERLYDQRFYDKLGVSKPEDSSDERVVCEKDGCTSKNAHRIEGEGAEAWLCPRHKMCAIHGSMREKPADRLVRNVGGGLDLLCSNHHCEDRDCWNAEDLVTVGAPSDIYNVLCKTHARERGFL